MKRRFDFKIFPIPEFKELIESVKSLNVDLELMRGYPQDTRSLAVFVATFHQGTGDWPTVAEVCLITKNRVRGIHKTMSFFNEVKGILEFDKYEGRPPNWHRIRLNESFYQRVDTGKSKKPNYVYLMKDHKTGFIKIGRSVNPRVRERTIRPEVPQLELLFSWQVKAQVETLLHKHFKDKRGRGEWFDLKQDDINSIRQYFRKAGITEHQGKPF